MQILAHGSQRAGAIGSRLVLRGDFREVPTITQCLGLGQKQGQLKLGAGLAQQFPLLGGSNRVARGCLSGWKPEVVQVDRRVVAGKFLQPAKASQGFREIIKPLLCAPY